MKKNTESSHIFSDFVQPVLIEQVHSNFCLYIVDTAGDDWRIVKLRNSGYIFIPIAADLEDHIPFVVFKLPIRPPNPYIVRVSL